MGRLAALFGFTSRSAVERERARGYALRRRITELEREVQGLERVLGSLQEGVLAVDRAGIVVHANNAAIRLLGMDDSRAIGHHMFAVVPEPSVCDMLERVMRSQSTGEEPAVEIQLERPLGEAITVVLAARPLRESADVRDDPEGAIAVLQDVSSLRRLESARADFFTNVSHELKTPVTAIRGLLETIRDDEQMPGGTRERFLDKARAQCDRLSALVADLLSLSRLETNPEALDSSTIDLQRLVGASAGDVADGAEKTGVSVQIEGLESPLAVAGDEEALRRAITNLVVNAVAFSEQGGEVTIRLEREGDEALVSVVDRGEGIPAEHLDRIFERFYRVDKARSRERGGTGIGLSIVKHVALAHGGTVTVSSEQGAGSTFVLRLPAVEPGR